MLLVDGVQILRTLGGFPPASLHCSVPNTEVPLYASEGLDSQYLALPCKVLSFSVFGLRSTWQYTGAGHWRGSDTFGIDRQLKLSRPSWTCLKQMESQAGPCWCTAFPRVSYDKFRSVGVANHCYCLILCTPPSPPRRYKVGIFVASISGRCNAEGKGFANEWSGRYTIRRWTWTVASYPSLITPKLPPSLIL